MTSKERIIQILDEAVRKEVEELLSENVNEDGGAEVIDKGLLKLVDAKKITVSLKDSEYQMFTVLVNNKKKGAKKNKNKKKRFKVGEKSVLIGLSIAGSIGGGIAIMNKLSKLDKKIDRVAGDSMAAAAFTLKNSLNTSELAISNATITTNILAQILGAQSTEDLINNISIDDDVMDELIDFCQSSKGKARL